MSTTFRKYYPKVISKHISSPVQIKMPQVIQKNVVIPKNMVRPIRLTTHTQRQITPPQSKPSPPQPQQKILRSPPPPPPQVKMMNKLPVQHIKNTIYPQSRSKILDRQINTSQSLQRSQKIEQLKGMGAGRILIIIGAGPSVNEISFDAIKNHQKIDFMCINHPYEKVWPPKFWAFCDHTQYKRNIETWDKYTGIILNSTNVKAKKYNQYIFTSRPGKGFSLDITKGYHIGRSSTYAAMQVVHYMDYLKCYIFGVDMCFVGDKGWHYGTTNPDVSSDIRKQRFQYEAESYLWAALNLSESIRNKFIFCSNYNKWEFTKIFPSLDHNIAVQKIKEESDTLG